MTYVLVEKICVNEYVEHDIGGLGQKYQKPFLLSPFFCSPSTYEESDKDVAHLICYALVKSGKALAVIEELFGPVVPHQVSDYVTAGKYLDIQYLFLGHLFCYGKIRLALLLVFVSASICLPSLCILLPTLGHEARRKGAWGLAC